MKVEVIVPVYNALGETQRCLESVIRHSPSETSIIIVNDASDHETSGYLRGFAQQHINVTLLENKDNLGFLDSANRGLQYRLKDPGQADIKILLNSDTVVYSGWVEAFERCFASDSRIALATAVSNNAEGLSIPIPPGWSAEEVARSVQGFKHAEPYVDITTAVGFCMGIRVSALEDIGIFDRAFAPGYGEESDLHFRALAAGYRSVLVSDCFVYHQGHASFSEKKKALVTRNRKIFDQRWGSIYRNELQHNGVIKPVEDMTKTLLNSSPGENFDILFILPTAKPFGGVVVVFEICNRLIRSGVKAGAVVLGAPEPLSMQLEFAPIFVEPSAWNEVKLNSNIFVATHYETCQYAVLAHTHNPKSKLIYLIQGYEGWFPGATVEEVLETYAAIPNRIVVSEWLQDMLLRWGFQSTLIPDGVDTTFFYPEPRPDPDQRPLRLFTLLRDDPQGAYKISLEVMQLLKKCYPNLEIIGVGNLVERSEFSSLLTQKHVVADRKKMRSLYQQADIFMDSSMVQGFGLMGLEAMACGVATVLTDTGGIREYANDSNSIICPLGSVQGLFSAVERLIKDPALLKKLQSMGPGEAGKLDWEVITRRYKQYLEGPLTPMSLENYAQIYRFSFKRDLKLGLGRSVYPARQSPNWFIGKLVARGVGFSERYGIRPRVERIVRKFLPPKMVQSLREMKQAI